MPELPEIEIIRRELFPSLVKVRIVGLEIADNKIQIRSEDILNKTIIDLIRKGKYLFVIFNDRSSLLFHLGMTGSLIYTKKREILRFQRARIATAQGFISFCDARRFGKMKFLIESEREKVLQSLGLDPFFPEYTWDNFMHLFMNITLPVKNFLMNQNWISGIGNIYSSEILFLSKVHPEKRVNKLTIKEKKSLFESIPQVLNQAIQCEGTTIRDYQRTNGTRGFFQNCLKVYDREGKPCLVCGTPIERIKLAQRSTYFCPHCQKK